MVTIYRAAMRGFRERVGAMLIVGMYKEAFAKRVHMREFWSLIRARNFSYPKLEEFNNLLVPIHRSDQEWCSALII